MEILAVVLRVLHIAAAAGAIGAALYQWLAVRPALAALGESERAALLARAAAGWRGVALLIMAVLLITGLANFLVYKIPEVKPHPAKAVYHGLIGLKILLALMVFHPAAALVMPGAKGDRYRERGAFWVAYMLALYGVIIVAGAVLRYFNVLFPAAGTGA